jgi:tetratricopeptide (TPR) repeat protein
LWKALDYVDAARFCNAHGAHATTIDACRIGLSLDPDNAMLYVYRACAYDEFGQLTEAVADLESALRLAPRGPAAVLALITLALVRERLGDSSGALEAASNAIAIETADREAHAALGTLRAWHGDYLAAWPELECHWLDERMQFRQRFPGLAEWNGEPIDGCRLLLVHGQGLGDMLQMLRYLPQLRKRTADLVLECPGAMLGIVRALAGESDVFVTGTAPRDRFDVFARLMTLARLCGEDGTPGHSGVPYVAADDERKRAWAARLAPRDGRLRIGIAWAGNPEHPNDRRRSIPFEDFAAFADVSNVDWYSLQYGPHANDPAPPGLSLTRLGDAITDMSDTAAIVAQLDLVISIDTGLAHLAGAMGAAVWLLLPWRPDWRWSPTAHDTPWYPTMRLFHAGVQSWPALMPGVAHALRALIANQG